jgi:adenine/guanine phosphoribosyltransferase-like PRPP-binding protein
MEGEVRDMELLAMLLVVVVAVLYHRKKTSYTLDVRIEPEGAARISNIVYRKGRGFVAAAFSLEIEEGFVLHRWTGTLPRLEGYDPSRWYDSKNNKVYLEIDRNEKLTLHFERRSSNEIAIQE